MGVKAPVSEPMNDNETEVDRRIERTDVGVSITSEIKRGTGTRDQDKHVVKAKGATLEDAMERHRGAIAYLEIEVFDLVREIQTLDLDAEADEE
jgi:hypothetical protein